MVTAVRLFHVDDHIFARDRQANLHVVYLAVVLMPMRRIEHDPARLYAIADYAEMFREFVDTSLDGG